MAKRTLQRQIRLLRTIEEHRTKAMERTLRREYNRVLREIQHYVSDEYLRYGEDGLLDFGRLNAAGEYARFLDEVLQSAGGLAAESSADIRGLVEEVYTTAYEGIIDAVGQTADSEALARLLEPIRGVRPETLRAAVQNPVSGLTLDETLERHRRDIIYNIKRSVTVGLMNGDRYSTMAARLHDSLNGDYKKAIRIVRTEAHRVSEQGHYDGAAGIDEKLKAGASGVRFWKIWRTALDERVRPQRGLSKKTGKRLAPSGHANHMKMEGVAVLRDEEFDLGDGVTTLMPGSSGDAGNDINCRCYVEYEVRDSTGDETFEAAAESGIIKDVEKGPDGRYPITKESLQNVEAPRSEILTPALSEKLGQENRLLLEAVADKPVGTEIIRTFDMGVNRLHERIGEPGAGEVKPIREGIPYISVHNHPSGGIFSPNDVERFILDANVQIVAAVGNNGRTYIIEKLPQMDASGFMRFYTKEKQNYINDLIGFMETVLGGAADYGFHFDG